MNRSLRAPRRPWFDGRMTAQTTSSADGTTIAYHEQGEGPAVVIVNGAMSTAGDAGDLASALAGAGYRAVSYDRRARVDSGDTRPYAPQREAEDLAAVIDAVGGVAAVLGHSSGAVLALYAGSLGVRVGHLFLSEPPFNFGDDAPEGFEQRLQQLVDDGKTVKRWSETTVRRVSAYLTGCCADYGMLERGLRSSRRILPFRISPLVAAYLAYELHFSGVGDNALLAHDDWQLFGLAREDVLEEIKRLSLKGSLIVQAAGDVIRISWKQQDMEGLCDVLAQG